jgi:hypothetical protein
MGQAEERIKDYMDNLDQHCAEHCENENLQNDKSNLLDAQVSGDCERTFTEKRIIELVDQEMKTELKEPMNEEEFDDLRYKIFGIISCALKLESNSR